jgi:acetyltransferase-like isoleucine patch superfamily enzyme
MAATGLIAGGEESRRSLRTRVRLRLARQVLPELCQRPRIWKYRALSSARLEGGAPILNQPALFIGHGTVRLGEGVQFGWRESPLFYAGYCHVEVSHPDALFEVGEGTEFNNNLFVKSEGAGIKVGRDGLFGANIEIFDSNFHDLDPDRRKDGEPRTAPVEIGDNVFVGMGVKILKGVTIGSDSVIGAGSVVSSSIPAGVIAAGNPARVIRSL